MSLILSNISETCIKKQRKTKCNLKNFQEMKQQK